METIKRDEGTGITYRRWLAKEPKAIFLLVHGLGAHSARWDFLSGFFLQKGISSYAIELRGFGETKNPKGHINSLRTYNEDICALREMIVKENSDKKVFLIGESMGGLISFLVAAEKPGIFDGLVCISPAFGNRLKLGISEYFKIAFSLMFNPKEQFDLHFTSEMCTRDRDYQRVMNEDPREYRLASAKLLFEIITAQLKSGNMKNRINIPVLFLLAGEDQLVDPGVSKRIFNGLTVKNKSLIEYKEMRHALSIEAGREKVFEDILEWTKKRI